MKLAAIDFETANYWPTSICAAGLAIFEDGELTESLHWLVRPPKGHGWFIPDFTDIHGITHLDVLHAQEFVDIAPAFLEKMLAADLVVAHNARFDVRILLATLRHYGVEPPVFKYDCTLRLARAAWPDLPRHTLDVVAKHIGFELKHHDAKADAEAAGWVMIEVTKRIHANVPMSLVSPITATDWVMTAIIKRLGASTKAALTASTTVGPND